MLLVDPNPELMVFENEPTPGKSGVFVKKSSGYFASKMTKLFLESKVATDIPRYTAIIIALSR
jgi:hypothetical protein